MKLFPLLLMLQIIVISPTLVAAEDLVAPTLQHCNRYTSTDDRISYFFQDLAQELGRRLTASVEDMNVSMKRCIRMLKTGQADFMFAAHNDDERSKFMDFIHSTSTDSVVFMVRKEDGDWLRDYSDLEDKKVGLLGGYSYFPKLNTDNDIDKLVVLNQAQLPKILLRGRVDSFVTYNSIVGNILLGYPDLAKASFSVDHFELGFITISKESPLHHRLDELESIVLSMIDDGYIDLKAEEYLPGVILPFVNNTLLMSDNIVY